VKIILVHNQYQQPGGEDVVFEQERRLLERAGHQVAIYQRSNLELEESSAARRLVMARNIVWAKDTQREFTKLLASEKPELVHIHNTFVMVSPSVYSACEEANVPVVQTLHNYRFLCPAATFFRDGHICEECMEHSLLRSIRYGCYRGSRSATAAVALMLAVHRGRQTWDRKVNSYLALTEFARRKFVAGGLPAERIFVKPNFVYPDPGPRLGTREYAVFAGRLSAEKLGRTLLAAWERLGSRIPLLIVGEGPERKQLEWQIAEHRLSNVSLLGQLTRQETWATIGKARCFIMPSECYENFPLTIAEAFACGTPVICSRLGAMQEIVQDGRTGLHFTPGDADDLAAKVDWAWTRPDLMKVMGQEARREYEAKYTAERNYEMLAEIYQHTLQNRASLPSRERPQPKLGWRIHVRRAQDLVGKAWTYLLTALARPGQLLHLPTLILRRVHFGEFLKLNKPWLKKAGVRTVIDVGAHSGEFSSAVRAVLPDVQIYAFEPLPDCCKKLKQRIRGNGSLRVFQVALGEQSGPVEFWRSSFAKSSSLLRMSRLHQEAFPWSAASRPMVVQLGRLDDYADKMELSSKTLLKIDVQGYEDRVLQGASELLKQISYVIVEVSVSPLYEKQAKFHNIYTFLLESGFAYDGNLEQLVSPADGAILQVDALFSRP
jgi:FkbM family methyltransferase